MEDKALSTMVIPPYVIVSAFITKTCQRHTPHRRRVIVHGISPHTVSARDGRRGGVGQEGRGHTARRTFS